MRKLILCAAAAIVALASCSKTEVINTEVPQEIGFKAVNGAMTKATNDLIGTMGVFAYVHDGAQLKDYFGNTKFSKDQTSGNWVANPTKYWPVAHNLDFVVCAPYIADTEPTDDTDVFEVTTDSNGNKVLTINADNTDNTDYTNGGTDYLYGNEYYDGTGSGYGKTENSIPVQLNHAMAKVTVNFSVSDVVITDVRLLTAVREGTCTVTYGPSTKVAWASENWENLQIIEKIDATTVTTSPAVATASVLLVPETSSEITFKYQIKGSDAELSYTIPQTSGFVWAHGTHYTYNVTVTPKEIKFSPTVLDWTEVTNNEHNNL